MSKECFPAGGKADAGISSPERTVIVRQLLVQHLKSAVEAVEIDHARRLVCNCVVQRLSGIGHNVPDFKHIDL